MKRSFIKHKRGFTLIEALTTMSILSIVLSCLILIYTSVSAQWTQEQTSYDSLSSANEACNRMYPYIKTAMNATTASRFNSNDTLFIAVPADKAYNIYVPTKDSNGDFVYRKNFWIIFYLSDKTGSIYRSGDILWGGTCSNLYDYPNSIYEDAVWSMYYTSGKGRIANLSSLNFSVVLSSGKPLVKMSVTSEIPYEGSKYATTITRSIFMQNAN